MQDASPHTPKWWDKQFNTCRSPAASRRLECCSKATSNSAQRLLQCCSKVPPMLLEGSSNSARMFLQFCSKTAPMLLECSSNSARILCEVETATEQNLQNRDTSKQEPVEAMRKINSSCRIRERLGLGFFCISCFRRHCLRRPIL